jgi:hypothetical protein
MGLGPVDLRFDSSSLDGRFAFEFPFFVQSAKQLYDKRRHTMGRPRLAAACLLALAGLCCSRLSAQDWTGAGRPPLQLTYNAGSSAKIEQVTGDCDWAGWDATITVDSHGKITNSDPSCTATLSRTVTRFDVLGHDLGSNFEHNGQLIFVFGDTIGATDGCMGTCVDYSPWTTVVNDFPYMAGDTFASSTTLHAEDGLLLNYFVGSDPSHANTIQPRYPAGATPGSCAAGGVIATGADDVPSGGLSLNGQVYFSYSSGSNPSDYYSHLNNCSILVRFDEASQTFTAGRQISQEYYPLPSTESFDPTKAVATWPATFVPGHFITNAMHILPAGFGLFAGFNEPSPFGATPWEPGVLIFGEGQHRGKPTGSSVYLSYIPADDFWSGMDSHGKPATRYFAGFQSGHPAWSENESDSVPVVYDNPNGVTVPSGAPGVADPGTVGEISVVYSPRLGLWLMTYDGGRQDGPNRAQTTGIYFTYAAFPWGPWSTPQLILNSCREHALGNYMFFDASTDSCAGLATTEGPAGPTIGGQSQSGNDPFTTTGDPYAPETIERFVEVQGDMLKLFYTMSTWNPYAVVLMESDFKIAPTPPWLPFW